MRFKSLIILTICICITLSGISCVPPCPDVGQSAPDFTIQNIDGKNVSLSDFKGKIVILNFWATWCGPCQSETPFFEAVHKERASKGLVILAIDFKESPSTVKNFASTKGISFPILLDTEAKVSEKYCLPSALPITIFINSEGIIKARKVGAFRSQAEFESMIDSL
jgi:cytochrome c biogenesis protein CcmG/thiol:disulfide interchange protein DsbE